MTPCSCGPHRHLPPTATAPACLECPCEQLHDVRPALAKPPTPAELKDTPMPAIAWETYRGKNGGHAP